VEAGNSSSDHRTKRNFTELATDPFQVLFGHTVPALIDEVIKAVIA
jgi:hypothetical protein